jgi:GH25 family lysozyme M1 (1,4-beta-N-acetylmuramidase)
MRAIGIDTSWYERQSDPTKVTSIPDFWISRASEGIEGKNEVYPDNTFAGFMTVARQLGVKLVGGYHYLSAADLTSQIDTFVKQMAASKPDFAAVDVECDYDTLTEKRAWAVIDAANKQLNLPCYLYVNGSGWKQCFMNKGGWNDYPLFWLSQPTTLVNDIIPDTMEPSLPSGRKSWSMWQYKFAAKALPYGITATRGVDINVYNGGIDQMRKDLGIPQPVQPSTGNIAPPVKYWNYKDPREERQT